MHNFPPQFFQSIPQPLFAFSPQTIERNTATRSVGYVAQTSPAGFPRLGRPMLERKMNATNVLSHQSRWQNNYHPCVPLFAQQLVDCVGHLYLVLPTQRWRNRTGCKIWLCNCVCVVWYVWSVVKKVVINNSQPVGEKKKIWRRLDTNTARNSQHPPKIIAKFFQSQLLPNTFLVNLSCAVDARFFSHNRTKSKPT